MTFEFPTAMMTGYAARIAKWHPWFAWRPARVQGNEYRWLEVVERRWCVACDWAWWEYRVPKADEQNALQKQEAR
jgi:hypothetical protein